MCCGDLLRQVLVGGHNLEYLKIFLTFLGYYLKGAKCEDRTWDREKESESERDSKFDDFSGEGSLCINSLFDTERICKNFDIFLGLPFFVYSQS